MCIRDSPLPPQRPLAGGSDDDDSDEDCLDTIPLMCGDSFEMDESDRLVKERRRRRSQYRSLGYFLSEGWINLCARYVQHHSFGACAF